MTVAISTWNRAHLVGRALASALAQTFMDIEILVVDDGSTDATPEVLARVDDRRLRIVRLEQNGGISRARNTALARARGEWLAFLDDDNEWAPDYLERQLALATARPGADVIYCRAQRRDARTGHDPILPTAIREGRVARHLLRGWLPLMSCALIRRSAMEAVGGVDEALKASEDRDLLLRLALRGDFAGTPDVLMVRHEHPGTQLSRNYTLLTRDAVALDRKWKATVTASYGRVAYWRWRAVLRTTAEIVRAMQAAEKGDRLDGIRSIGRLVPCLPWSIPYVARGAVLTFLGPTIYRRLVLSQSAARARVSELGRARQGTGPRSGRARPDDRRAPGAPGGPR